MGFLSQFSIARATTAETMARYDKLYGDYKRGKLSYLQQAKFLLLDRSIKARLKIVEVTPDEKNHDLHQQMAGKFEEGQFKGQSKDLVHEYGVEDTESLKANRLGGENSNKTAYALIDPETKTVLSAIYVYRSETPVVEGQGPYDHVPGNVHAILHEPLRALNGTPTSLVFFSISRFFKMSGEGELLISKLHAHLNKQYADHPNIVFSTLSPLRGLKEWCDKKYGRSSDFNASEKFNAALLFLIEGSGDLVKRFHLSNGATVGAIRLDANVDGSKDSSQGLGAMINYIYNRNPHVLLKNAASFHMSKVVERLAPGLLQHIQQAPDFDAFVAK